MSTKSKTIRLPPALPPQAVLKSLTILLKVETPAGTADLPMYIEPGQHGGYQVCLDWPNEWTTPFLTFEDALQAITQRQTGMTLGERPSLVQ